MTLAHLVGDLLAAGTAHELVVRVIEAVEVARAERQNNCETHCETLHTRNERFAVCEQPLAELDDTRRHASAHSADIARESVNPSTRRVRRYRAQLNAIAKSAKRYTAVTSVSQCVSPPSPPNPPTPVHTHPSALAREGFRDEGEAASRIVASWNRAAAEHGMVPCQRFGQRRAAMLRRALLDHGEAAILAAVTRASLSPVCTGTGSRGQRMGIEVAIDPENIGAPLWEGAWDRARPIVVELATVRSETAAATPPVPLPDRGEPPEVTGVRAALVQRLGARVARSWIDPLELVREGDMLVATPRSSFTGGYVRDNLSAIIAATVREHWGPRCDFRLSPPARHREAG